MATPAPKTRTFGRAPVRTGQRPTLVVEAGSGWSRTYAAVAVLLRQQGQHLLRVVLGDPLHPCAVGEVAVQEAEGAGHQGETHREREKIEPGRIESGA